MIIFWCWRLEESNQTDFNVQITKITTTILMLIAKGVTTRRFTGISSFLQIEFLNILPFNNFNVNLMKLQQQHLDHTTTRFSGHHQHHHGPVFLIQRKIADVKKVSGCSSHLHMYQTGYLSKFRASLIKLNSIRDQRKKTRLKINHSLRGKQESRKGGEIFERDEICNGNRFSFWNYTQIAAANVCIKGYRNSSKI